MQFGVYVSNEDKSVLSGNPQDFSLSSDFDMYKIKQEKFAQNGETLENDHGLGYWPFFLAYRYSSDLANSRRLDVGSIGGTASFVNTWSFQTRAWSFVAYNFGVK